MTSHRLVLGSFVKTRKKPQLYGQIIEEEEQKKWSVKLESGETVSKTSNQLLLVCDELLPNPIRIHFGLEPINTVDDDDVDDDDDDDEFHPPSESDNDSEEVNDDDEPFLPNNEGRSRGRGRGGGGGGYGIQGRGKRKGRSRG